MENNLIFMKIRKKIDDDVKKIDDMIDAYLAAKKDKDCPLYQDIIDTQIFGLSKEISLAIEIGCFTNEVGRNILNRLEEKAAEMYSSVDFKSKVN